MTSIEVLKHERGTVKSQLTRFGTYLNGLTENADTDKLKLRIQQYEPLLSKFSEIQLRIEIIDNGTEDEVERESFETKYFDIMGMARGLIADQERVRLSSTNVTTTSLPVDDRASTSSSESFSRVKLPSINLPEFNGDYQSWSHFIDTFESLINNNTQISDVEKFHYLKSCLKGEAEQILSSLEINNANYQIAYDLLKQRYENKRLIKHKHIKALFELNPVKTESHSQLRKLLDNFNKNYRALNALGLPTSSWDALTVYILSSKLDPVSKRAFEEATKDIEDPTVTQLEKFLNERCFLLETIETKAKSSFANPNDKRIFTHVTQATNDPICSFCKQSHFNYVCERFSRMSFDDKLHEVKRLNLCRNCLRPGHMQIECKSPRSCRHCNKRHNSLLHRRTQEFPKTERTNIDAPSENTQTASGPICNLASCIRKSSMLATVQLHILDKHGKPVLCRALLDNASMANFMTYELYRRLNLKSLPVNQPLGGIANSHSRADRALEASIRSIDGKYSSHQEFYLLDEITQKLPQQSIQNLQIPENVSLADESFNVPGKIDVLLDVGVYYELLCVGLVRSNIKGIVLQKTLLGWVVAGNLKLKPNGDETPVCSLASLSDLSRDLSKFWEIENEFDPKGAHPEENYCEKHFLDNVKRDRDGRFQVALPFKESKQQLGATKEIAIKRFLNLERRFTRDSELKQQYVSFIDEYIRMNHAVRIRLTETDQEGCFLPHHGVWKQDSTTTKLRVVFDASAKSTNGVSLNDILRVGPALQRDLISIILTFRMHALVIVGDIEKMYRQVGVCPADQKYQKIVWRDNPQEPLECVVLKTVTYGTAPASFLAVRSLHQAAIEHQDEFPVASKAILKDFYMDDLLTGATSVEDALKLKDEITHILSQYGFNIRKWRANFPIKGATEDNQNVVFDGENAKTLGLLWHSGHDCFNYTVNFHVQGRITKRSVLSAIARLFDPIGLLGPVVLEAKLIMQDIWKCKIDWDESLPMAIFTAWGSFVDQFRQEAVLEIPRLATLPDYSTIQVHGFSDACERAYGCCIYIRTTNPNGKVMTRLLCSKSRVAPLKTISLPRLELCAAVLLIELFTKVKQSLEIEPHNVWFWCDSTIVLHWINAQSSSLKTFVANRVSYIQTNSLEASWRHIPSKLNPADIISRGSKVNSLPDLWWFGPTFLKGSEEEWPANAFEAGPEIDVEKKKMSVVTLIVTEDCGFECIRKYSRLPALLRVFAYVLRFISNLRERAERRSLGPLSAREIDRAQTALIKHIQTTAFAGELSRLNDNKRISKRSSILPLNPFLDQDELLRVGGRIRHSDMPYDKKHPLLLPGNHHLTKLIIENEHKVLLHAGCETVLASLRERFWPINGKSIVKRILRQCHTCFKHNLRVNQPIMGDLPVERITPAFPFSIVGIDFAGPIMIKNSFSNNRSLIKSYLCVIVCFVSKAIHLEIATDLTTQAFLNCLKRFVSRRGLCQKIFSDNGRNFVGANNEFKKLYTRIRQDDDIQNYLVENKIEWSFIPPRSPNFGGLWESSVKSVKTHLVKVLGRTNLSYEQLSTLICQIEAIINSRPLTPNSTDPNDLSALTPAHLLIGRTMKAVPEVLPDADLSRINSFKTFQRLQLLVQHYWRRWSREYLSSLQQRARWKSSSTKLTRINQLVVVHEDNIPPLQWKLGRIVAVYPGPDGVVRVADIKTNSGVVRRSVRKLSPLPE